ncbi:MAG TPA: retroviral-like aspartic protease family protein [Phenylobacterium sp.]
MAREANRRDFAALLAAAGAAVALTPIVAFADAPQPAPLSTTDLDDDTAVDIAATANRQVTAPIYIDGDGPFSFLVDTGANTSCISVELAKQLELPAGPMVKVNTVAGVRPRASVLIDKLQVGSRTHRRMRAPVLPVSGLVTDGLLGVDWLKGQRLVLGFSKGRMEITRSRTETAKDGQVIVPARRKSGQLTIVDADLSGERISAIVDSGSEVSLGNEALRALVRRKDRGSTVGARVNLISVAGEKFYGEGGFLPFIRLGGLHLGNVPVVYADTHVFRLWDLHKSPALILGMDVLRQFETVALDFGRSAVRFDVSEAPA